MKIFKAICVVFLFFVALTFCLQNTDEVTLRYYTLVEEITLPAYVVVLASVLLGILIGLISGGLAFIRLKIELGRRTKEAEELRKELQVRLGVSE